MQNQFAGFDSGMLNFAGTESPDQE